MPVEAGEAVLDRLTAVGLIDDQAFAQMWVQSRHRDRGLARATLRQELARKGVDPQIIDSALSALDSDDEYATAIRLVTRKLPSTRGLPVDTQVRRLVGLLARKGYASGTAYSVVRAVLRDEREMPTF